MPWRSPSRLRSEPGAAARQAPFAGGRLLTVMMPRGYYRPRAAGRHLIRIAAIRAMAACYTPMCQMGRISSLKCRLLLFLRCYLALREISFSKQAVVEHVIRHPDVMPQNCRQKTKLGT